MRPVKTGKGVRMTFSRQKEVLEMPNLIEIQKNSYQWFLDEGLKEVFADISPITDFAGHLSLEFVDFTLCKNDIKYTIEECKERDATYAAPLKVKVRLCNKDKDEINEHEIFMGDLTPAPSLSTERSELSSASLFVPLVFIMESRTIRSVQSYTAAPLSRTGVPGWSMRQIPTTFSTCV